MYDVDDFLANLPDRTFRDEVDAETEETLHVGRWPLGAFDEFADFLAFNWVFSSGIQPHIFDPDRPDLAEWVLPDPENAAKATESLKENPPVAGEIRDWLGRHYPDVSIDWLAEGENGRVLHDECDGWPEMQGHDSSGYYCAFVADAT